MIDAVRYSESTLGWLRKPGPLRVWRVVEGRKKTADGKTLRFSIQEVPEDRHVDVLDHMCTIFLKDEVICHHLGVINNPETVADFRKLWNFAIQQGIVVAAFLVDENNPKPVLAGVNMTLVKCEATEKGLTGIELDNNISVHRPPQSQLVKILLRHDEQLDIAVELQNPDRASRFWYQNAVPLQHHHLQTHMSASCRQAVSSFTARSTFSGHRAFTSEDSQKVLRFMADFEKEHDARKVYGVEKYMSAFGLSVDPAYRGQGLGFHLLKARDEMSVAYDIQATTTVFTAVPAQKVAAQAGFELLIERNFADIKNADGSETFPGIGQKSCKLMGKRFRDANKSTPDD